MDSLLFVAGLCAALGAGLMAGLFFAFSICVMKALGSRPAAEGIGAMQAINAAILNPLFGVVLFGTPLACAVVIVAALLRWQWPGSAWLVAGGALYIAGGFLVTVLVNVPLNNALAKAVPAEAQSARLWSDYVSKWTAWNHVRAVASLAATALLTLGLR